MKTGRLFGLTLTAMVGKSTNRSGNRLTMHGHRERENKGEKERENIIERERAKHIKKVRERERV